MRREPLAAGDVQGVDRANIGGPLSMQIPRPGCIGAADSSDAEGFSSFPPASLFFVRRPGRSKTRGQARRPVSRVDNPIRLPGY
jgi:hypothetical protein